MRSFITALQFLTRIHLVKQEDLTAEDFGRSTRFFPLVGAVLGCLYLLAALACLALLGLPSYTAKAILVILPILLTGGLHCDGFMDAVDGLFSGRSRERMLEIMKDSRAGSFGVVAFGSSLDQVGPFARSVEDAAAAMDALCGHDPLDCTSQDVKAGFRAACQQDVAGMRVDVVRSFMDAKGLSSEVSERVSEAAAKLEAAGATIVEVDLPHIDAAISAYYVLGPCEAFSNLARFDSVRYGYCEEGHKDLGSQYEASRAHGFGEEAKRRIMLGSYLLSSGVYEKYYYPAQQVRTLITQDYQAAYEKCDVILAPTSPRTAFKFGEIGDPVEMHLSDIFTVSINIAGNGGMNVPCGLGSDTGLPVGVQLIAPQFKDENMFRAAAALEAVYGAAPIAPDFAAGKAGE